MFTLKDLARKELKWYIFSDYSQKDASYLAHDGEVWGLPCECTLCFTFVIIMVKVICYTGWCYVFMCVKDWP